LALPHRRQLRDRRRLHDLLSLPSGGLSASSCRKQDRGTPMTLHTKLCDLLGVTHPIMLAGMGGVSYAELVAAVSNAGGYGVLGMAGRSPDFIQGEMRKVKSLTDKPFGVDLLAASPDSLTASVEIIMEEGASSFVAGLGVPMPIMEKLKTAGLQVMVVCGAVKHAV